MPKPQPGSAVEPPLFSIIIPLEDHRGQWKRSWLSWQAQTIDKSLYEIVLVVPSNSPLREELSRLGAEARIEWFDHPHDMGLCAFGARQARGKFLFLTESHCWPEPNVLELCIGAFQEHPEWAGFSCRSIPVCHNRLSAAEAEMYQADIDFGMKVHPWLRVLDQCFVTRRQAYDDCGGLRAEFGHFAEWLLAANYFARGHAIGYLDEAHFHHHYVGRLDELKAFTLDFIRGEIRCLSEGLRDPGSKLLDIPVEWSCQDNFDAELARNALGALLRDSSVARSWRRPDEKWRAFWRWAGPALFGDRLARSIGLMSVAVVRCVLSILVLTGSRSSIACWLARYIAALIHAQRLACIRNVRQSAAGALPRLGDQVLAQAGFHAPETLRGHAFRWSEPVAAVRIEGLPGRNIVRMQCLAARGPLDRIRPRFYFEGGRVADSAIATTDDSFILCLDLPPSGRTRLAWVCSRLSAKDDRRRLGLPIAAIEVGALSGHGDTANVAEQG